MSAVATSTEAAVAALLESYAAQGLQPVHTSDLAGDVHVNYIDEPALLINTRAHPSVLAGAAAAMAARLRAFAELATLCPNDGINMQPALDAMASMASEVVQLTSAVASHRGVMQASSWGQDQA